MSEKWRHICSQSLVFGLAVLYPPEVKFHVFGTSKHGEGKSRNFFAILISALGRFYRANKKNICHVHFKESWSIFVQVGKSIIGNCLRQENGSCIRVWATVRMQSTHNSEIIVHVHLRTPLARTASLTIRKSKLHGNWNLICSINSSAQNCFVQKLP